MSKPFRCRLGLHKWARRFTAEGSRYQQCARCGVDDGRAKVHWSGGGAG